MVTIDLLTYGVAPILLRYFAVVDSERRDQFINKCTHRYKRKGKLTFENSTLVHVEHHKGDNGENDNCEKIGSK